MGVLFTSQGEQDVFVFCSPTLLILSSEKIPRQNTHLGIVPTWVVLSQKSRNEYW